MKSIIAVLALPILLLAGCSREDIQVYRTPKDAPAPAPMAGMHGSEMELPPGHPEVAPGEQLPGASGPAVQAGQTGDLHWHAPSSWKEKPVGSMRLGSYSIPGKDGEADMSIVMLGGGAGGTLPNVERWRSQVGLEPLGTEKALAAASSKVKTRAGEVLVVDFTGAGNKRLLAGILPHGEESWFFKMMGPAATVGAAKPGFMELLNSLHAAGTHE